MLRQSPTSLFSSDLSSFFSLSAVFKWCWYRLLISVCFSCLGIMFGFIRGFILPCYIFTFPIPQFLRWVFMNIHKHFPLFSAVFSNCSANPGNPGKHGINGWCQLVQVAASHSQDTPQDFASSGFRWCCDVSASGGTAGMVSAIFSWCFGHDPLVKNT